MKSFKLFLTVLFLAVLGLGNAWGADWTPTVSKTVNDLQSANSWTVSSGSTINTLATEFSLDDVVTISTSGSANCGSIWGTTTYDWRLYQAQSGDVTLSVEDGYELVAVRFTYSVSNTGTLKDGTTTIASNTIVNLTGTSKTFTVGNTGTKTNGQVRVTKFEVEYKSVSGDPEPTCSTPTITFAEGAEVAKLTTDAAFTNAASVEFESTATGQTITYSVEDGKEGVATVNASTGEVTIVGAGEAKIYASVEADATYCEKSAYYTLTVTEPAFECGVGSTEFALGSHADFSGLSSSYAAHTFEYTEADVVCASVTKQSSTITDCPVTKGGDVEVKAKGGRKITSIHFEFAQWAAKTQTATLLYSTDGGVNYSAFEPAISSTDFELTCASLPANTDAVKVTFSSASNQIGLVSICAAYTDPVAASVATPELSVAAGTYEGTKNVKVSNYDAALSYYYTLDGTAPTSASTAYDHAAGIDVTASATLKVIAYDAESNASEVASAAYVIIPVYASLAELVAAGAPTTTGWTVKVTLTDVAITSFQPTKGVWVGDVELYGGVAYPNTWEVGGKLSGTLTCPWKLYSTTKELCPSDWSGLEYTAPEAPIADPEYASLAALIEGEGAPTAGGKNVKVTFTNDVITRITGDRKGIFFMVGEQEVEVYCSTTCPAEWTANGQVFGTLVEGSWKLYSGSTWEIVVADWTAFEYTAYVSHVTGVTFANGSVFAGKTLDLATLVEIAPADASNKNVSFEIVSGSEYISLSEGVATGVAEGAAVVRVTTEDGSFTADATITVEAVSAWATTYTSNVTLSTTGGSSATASKVKVNGEDAEYDAIKAGTSKADGIIKVTLPLGTTKLHFHAVTWSGSAATATLSVKKDGDDTELFGNVIRPNTGLSSNSPYTLAGDPTDDYYCINFGSALAEATTVVFDASVDRFAIYGVNVEKVEVELLSIAISGTPTTTEYYAGQAFDPTGLVVTGTYNIGEPQEITEGISWSITPTTLALGATSVTLTATVGDKVSNPFVVNGLTVSELPSLGDAVIIVFPYNDSYYAMKSDLSVAEVRMINGKVFGIAEDERIDYTWYKNEADGKATFQTVAANYLAGATGTTLTTQATKYEWNVVDGHYEVTIGTSQRSFLMQNNNGTLAVKNYAITNVGNSNYSGYAIFATEFADGEIDSRELTGMGTHCYPYTIKAGEYEGASFYVPAYRIGTSKIYWDEVTGDIEAGKPYLVVPDLESTELTFVKQEETVAAPVAVDYGMVGNFTAPYAMIDANDGNYIVYNNQFRLAGNYVAVGQYRAYIHLADVSDQETAPAPGRKRIVMQNADTQVATDLDELNNSSEASKVIINGHLFILRGEKMYDAAGRLVE